MQKSIFYVYLRNAFKHQTTFQTRVLFQLHFKNYKDSFFKVVPPKTETNKTDWLRRLKRKKIWMVEKGY